MIRLSNTKSGVSYPLLVDKKYTVGRKLGEITCPEDQSVSRTHAEVMVEHPAGNINEPLLTPVLTVQDLGSKFGTFATEDNINSKTAVNARERVTLSVGDKLRFGLQWNEYKVDYLPFVATSSSYKATSDFKAQIIKVGGHYINEWNASVTHVVMESFTLTVKAVCALLAAKPIVTPAYISDLTSAFEMRKTPPDPKGYLPPVVEKGMTNLDASHFQVTTSRTTLFAGKTFLFYSSKHLKKLAAAVKAGGGTAKLVSDIIGEDVLKSEYIIMGHSLDVADGEKDSRVKAIVEKYKQGGKRLIPDSEIGLAAVYNSIEKHCNPKCSIVTAVLPPMTTQTQNSSTDGSVPLVPETQNLGSSDGSRTENDDSSINIVNETVWKQGTGNAKSQTDRGEKRSNVESGSSSSKKRSAEEGLSRPEVKRLREVSSPSTSASSQKSTSNRTLTTLFQFSDDEDDISAVPETQPDLNAGNVGSEMDVVPESQVPLVSIVDVRNLQSVESIEYSLRVRPPGYNFRAPASPVTVEVSDNDSVHKLGTDFIETVTTSVMNAKTVPLTMKLNEDNVKKDAKRVRRVNKLNETMDDTNVEGPSRKRRREEPDEIALVERTKKVNLQDQGTSKVKDELATPSTSFVKKPLVNLNHSRNVSLLGDSGSSNANSNKKNFKSFRKVTPAFVSEENKTKWIDTTVDVKYIRSVKMKTYDYFPGESNYRWYGNIPPPLDPRPGSGDIDTPEEFIRFNDAIPHLENVIQRERKKREEEERKREEEKAARGDESPSTSARSRFSPRKRNPALKLSKRMTPPPPPIAVPDEDEEDEDDMWSFKR